MANLSHSESRRMYSWWWDSHISPKNSKWLQENLTDMDAKVKIMIKLIEEDADSFARRAEMYFKKRPELMKLVEEFYRAYRALAERYDHATGALRQAHRTMAEAFPNQVPFLLADDLPSGFFASEVQPHTPEKQHPVRAMLDPDDLHKDSVGLSSSHLQAIKRNGATADETDSVTSKTGLKQLNELFGSVEGVPQYVKFAHGRTRKGMNYHEEDRNDSKREMHIGARDQSNHMMKQGSQVGIFNQNLKTQIKSSSEQARKVEAEVQNLKYSLEEMEAEKEACLLQYQHALERLSSLEAEVSRSEEDSRRLNERASKAETEVRTLNEALIKLQAEKEGDLLQYQQCVERISDVEKKISNAQEDAKFDEKTISGETDPQSLKQAFIRVEAEKEASLFQYTHCLEKICYLETKVSVAEDNARSLNERAVRAETELLFLKETIAKLNEEKEAAALQYQRSLETISTLQSEVSHAQDEATRLSSVMVMGLAKLSSMEEQYIQLERENQSLQTEIDTLVQMMTIQKQELSEKQEELEGLQDFIEEEKFRSMETEDAFEALQNLHSECKEERGALVLEVQDGAQQFNEMELEYQSSEEETWHVKEGNPIMNEKNLSSFTAEKSLPDEIFRAREAGVKLDKEVEVLVDQRNALQQEIFYLKEEMDDLRKQHVNVTEEMELVGLKPDCFASSVKSLQDENSKLKEICQKQNSEKESLSKKLKDMENIFENNAVLENSFSDVNIGLESLREKIKALEESCRSLKRVYSTVVDEKESLISLMEMANRNAEKLSQKNSFLESFLFDANVERAWLREKSNSLEEYCQSLDSEKCDLFSAKNNLSVQLKTTQQELDDLGKSYTDLEENYLRLEKKMAAKIHEVEELQATLNLEKQEHASFIHTSKSQLAHLEGYNQSLEEEVRSRMKDFEDEQDKDVKAQLEIFILLRCIRDMEDRELSLFSEYQKLSETSKSSESLVINLERVNFEQQVKVNSLLDRVEKLRFGIRQLALVLGIDSSYECEVEIEKDQILLQLAMGKIEDLKSSLWTMEDDKHRLLLEKSVFLTVLGQLRLESASIESARSALDRDLKLRTKDLLSLKSERDILKSASDHLNHQIGMGKVILSQKEMELSETEQKLKAIQSENVEVHSKLKEVSREFVEAEIAREVLEKQILEISQSNTDKDKEIESLLEATQKLDFELNRLHEDIKEQRVKEENLCYELQQKGNEIKLWEHEAETLYLNNQTTDIHAALFKDKLNELVQACESLEQESDSKTEDNEKMKERLHALEDEARGVKSEMAAYLPVIVALKGSVTSLEDHLVLQTKNHAANNREIEVADLASHQHDNTNNEENQSLSAVDGFSDLLELQTRIEKIESTVIVQQKLMMQESFDEMMKLEAAMKEIQKLEQVGNESSNLKLYNAEHDYSEVGDEILVKDIPLDQVSHSSSYDHRLVPHAMSRREDAEKNEETLELWETVEHDFDLDLTFHQKKLAAVLTQEKSGSHEIVPEEEKSECPSSEIQSEDVGVFSKRGTTREEGNKKILERLASDARRLTNLQVTVQDLRKKMEQLDKLKNPNDAELNNLKGQLKEVEEAIMYLISTNGKLSKKAAGSPVASDGNASAELDETGGKARKSRTSERARRASEKIGRVQLEVQRIQFVLLRLEDRYKIKGSNKVGDRKVLLKDYLYGNLRSPQPNKRKKRLFFSCVKPPVA